MSDEIIKLLNETNLFAGIDDASLRRIADAAREETAEKNTFLYDKGDDSIDIYILLAGTVRFKLAQTTGVLSSGTLLKSRSVFGWAALVPDHPRRVGSAQCWERSTYLAIDGETVLEIMRADPRSGFIVMERLCAMIARNFLEHGA